MSASDLGHLIQELAMLMNSDDQDHGAEAARQLRVLSMDNRSGALSTLPTNMPQNQPSIPLHPRPRSLPLPACEPRLPSLTDSP